MEQRVLKIQYKKSFHGRRSFTEPLFRKKKKLPPHSSSKILLYDSSQEAPTSPSSHSTGTVTSFESDL